MIALANMQSSTCTPPHLVTSCQDDELATDCWLLGPRNRGLRDGGADIRASKKEQGQASVSLRGIDGFVGCECFRPLLSHAAAAP